MVSLAHGTSPWLLIAVLWVGLNLTTAGPPPENPLRMTISMDDFDIQGYGLAVSCVYNSSLDPRRGTLTGLTISKRHGDKAPFQDVVSVDGMDPDHVTLADGFRGEADASLTSAGEVVYLRLHVTGKLLTPRNEFRCHSTCIDRAGPCSLETRQMANVNFSRNKVLSNYAETMSDLQEKLNESRRDLEHCNDQSKNLLRLIGTLLQEQQGANFIWISDVFNSSVYVILSDKDNCTEMSGHLAEVNNEEEFVFLRETLRNHGLPEKKLYLLAGASYESSTSPFKFNVHRDDPVFTGYWWTDEPSRFSGGPNKLLLRFEDDELTMADGWSEGFDLVFLCEIPIV